MKTRFGTIPGLVGIIFIVTALGAVPCLPQEDTVHLTFRKKSEQSFETYVVKRGDRLIRIIEERFDLSAGDTMEVLKEVKRLNPQIMNINLIYPGEKILLPRELPPIEAAKEEIREIVLEGGETGKAVPYVVREGDTVVAILQKQLGKSVRESLAILESMSRFNPEISDLNRIYPGQRLWIPLMEEAVGRNEEQTETEEPRREEGEPVTFSVPSTSLLPVIARVAACIDGTFIDSGSLYIPLPPSGQVAVDTSKIPVIELDRGRMLLIDLEDRMPGELEKVVESTWKNYHFIEMEAPDAVPALIEDVVKAAGGYRLNKHAQVMTFGGGDLVKVSVNWSIRPAPGAGASPASFGINFLDDPAISIPANIRHFMWKEGFEVIEIAEGIGVTGSSETAPPCDAVLLKTGGIPETLGSFLGLLGYEYTTGSRVQVFSIENDGFNLTIQADIRFEAEDRDVVLCFNAIPEQFVEILAGRGTRVTVIPGEASRDEAIASLLEAVGILYTRDTFHFPLVVNREEQGEVLLTGFRIERGEENLCLVDYAVDRDVCGWLKNIWNIRVVQY
ncbi:MAG: LysM peptidoglycan-binding domain-containing protein [Deltaproteobacteria bacterium]|nr:LysM peptidoglycan-binding domain-containing protein [Deltaproteobacteria bacterium]